MTGRKMTPKERMHMAAFADAMRMLEYDSLDTVRIHQRVPAEWHAIHEDPDFFNKRMVKTTFRVNRDVLEYFRKMGPGHGERMNRVLKAYVHGRLARMVDGPDTTDFVLRPERVREQIGKRRPEWGESVVWNDVADAAE